MQYDYEMADRTLDEIMREYNRWCQELDIQRMQLEDAQLKVEQSPSYDQSFNSNQDYSVHRFTYQENEEMMRSPKGYEDPKTERKKEIKLTAKDMYKRSTHNRAIDRKHKSTLVSTKAGGWGKKWVIF